MSSVIPSSTPCNEGDVIAGKYRVERVLGLGGMGVVVAAMHLELEQRVALKFLLPHAITKADVAARFSREARSAAKIHSEHVTKVIDVGTLPDGAPYMVMEYLDGEDLEQLVTRDGSLPVELAVGYVLQACEAIAEAHSLGIVHRDLKPANLFLANRPNGPPVVKVLDFGISKSTLNTSKAHLTKTSSIVGSPLYMSPEQMASAKSVDTRSDIWALGIVLYQLLSGRTPFVADTMPELVLAVVNKPHEPVASFRADVPPGLDMAVQCCLEKNPANRYATIAELAEALAPFGNARSALSVERIVHVLSTKDAAPLNATRQRDFGAVGARSSQPQVPHGMTHAQWTQSTAAGETVVEGRTKVRRATMMAAVIGASALVGMALAMMSRHSSSNDAPPPVAATAPAPSAPSVAPPAPPAEPGNALPPSTGSPVPVASATPPERPPPVRPPPVAPPPRPAALPARALPPAHTAAASSGNCQLVSYPDSDGNMRFRKECK